MTSLAMDLNLPQYSPSRAAPEYSFEPTCGECTLQLTPRTRPLPESTYIKRSGKTTVVLHNQEENAKVPTYGRGGTIAGSILLDHNEHIHRVVLKVWGRLESISPAVGARTIKLLDTKQILWSDDQKVDRCPSQLCFSVRLPLTFRDKEEDWPLPPSYIVNFIGVPEVFVRSSYKLEILITRARSQKVDFLTKTKLISVPFEYKPHTRPPRPIVASPCFFSDIKATPEEWHQEIALMNTPPDAELEPIHTQLFTPSSQIFGIRDVIPVHVQLSGPARSLRGFLRPVSKERPKNGRPKLLDQKTQTPTSGLLSPTLPSSINSSSPSLAHPISDKSGLPSLPPPSQLQPPQSELLDNENKPTLRVFLLRQVTIETPSKKAWRNQILGEADLIPVPPLLSTRSSTGITGPEEDHLDWEGKLQIDERFTVGGWKAGDVRIKDFIALSVLPHHQRTSESRGIILTVPVKLVVDSWLEGGIGNDQLPLEAWAL